MIIEIILLLAAIFLIFQLDKKPKGFPPGLWGIPILGYFTPGMPTMEKLKEMKKIYGNTFSIRIGSLLYVFLTDFETIKSVFNKPEFQGRPSIFTLSVFRYFLNGGLIVSEGEQWTTSRRFALRHLRDLGVGKSRMQDSILNEARELVLNLEKHKGKPTELGFELNVAVLNVIWQLVASKRYDVDDPDIKFFINLFEESVNLQQSPAALLNAFPWLEKVLPSVIQNRMFKINQFYDSRDKVHKFIKGIIDEHVENHNPNDPQDYIDFYLKEVENEKGNMNTAFKEDYMDLLLSITDLFGAGSETSSSTLRWFVLLMAANQEEQKKVQALIDEIVPKTRQPALEDRSSLMYLDAILLETMRFSSFVALGVPHRSTSDSEINNYSIPKGSIIIACTGLCHYSEEYFERAMEFNPEHFISEDQELLTKKVGYAPFSIGRRQCLGESLAKTELFIFAATILQNFTISPHPDHPLDLGFDKSKPLFNFAKPYKVCFNKRI